MSSRVVPVLRWLGWAALLVFVLALANARIDAPVSPEAFALGAAAVAAAVTLVGIRARPWGRRLLDVLLAVLVVGGLAWLLLDQGRQGGAVATGGLLGAIAPRLRLGFLEAFDLGPPWPLLLALLGLLVVRLLLPPAAGSRVGRLVRVELGKLFAGRLLLVAALVVAAVPVASGLLQEAPADATGWSVWASLFGRGAWAAEIFVLVLGAVALAGEIGQGTMKMVLPHAYERAEWVVAKALVLLLAALLLVAVAYASSGIVAWSTLGLGDVVKEVPAGFGQEAKVEVFQSAAVMRSHLIDVGLVGIGSAASTAWLALAISAFFSGVVPALSLAFLLYLALRFGDLLLGLPREVTRVFPPSYPDWMRDIAANLGRGMNDRWDAALLPDGLSFALLVAALALLVALRAFDRRELG